METLKLSRLSRLPAHLTKNAAERRRQGALAQAVKDRSKLAAEAVDLPPAGRTTADGAVAGAADGRAGDGFETVDIGPLPVGGAGASDEQAPLGCKGRLSRWQVNDGRSSLPPRALPPPTLA